MRKMICLLIGSASVLASFAASEKVAFNYIKRNYGMSSNVNDYGKKLILLDAETGSIKKRRVTSRVKKNIIENKGSAGAEILQQKGVIIDLNVVPNVLQFDKKTFSVKAGQPVTINFENPDFMQHNLVILKTGSMDKVGAAADQLAADPEGAKKNYIPKLPEVLFSTKLLNPQEKITLKFTAPAKPGDYPFICTFPGHWRIMNGIMKVTK